MDTACVHFSGKKKWKKNEKLKKNDKNKNKKKTNKNEKKKLTKKVRKYIIWISLCWCAVLSLRLGDFLSGYIPKALSFDLLIS